MLGTLKFQAKMSVIMMNCRSYCEGSFNGEQRQLNFRLMKNRKLFIMSLSLMRQQQLSSHMIPDSSDQQLGTAAVGSSSPSSAAAAGSQLTHSHIGILNFIACAIAICATWLFCSAIPNLLAFKRAAESMEKLMDVTREELPDTMAAVRLSGMEISDLTMELSDLAQEITQGIGSSTRAVRLAEERLRRLTNITPSPSVSLQEEIAPTETTAAGGPVLARTVRNVREGIVKGRAILQMFFTISHYSRIAFNYFRTRAKACTENVESCW